MYIMTFGMIVYFSICLNIIVNSTTFNYKSFMIHDLYNYNNYKAVINRFSIILLFLNIEFLINVFACWLTIVKIKIVLDMMNF